MEQVLIELGVGPVLVATATLAARRWGIHVGGIVSAFPAIVGPVLLIAALSHGRRFASEAANGTLLGLPALAAFAVAYGRAAADHRWGASFLSGWVSACLVAVTIDRAVRVFGSPPGVLVAVLCLLMAYRAMPNVTTMRVELRPPQRRDLPARMLATALLVCTLAAAAERLGPLVGGMLAALPVLASVLAVFTQRAHGPEAAIELLRGMLAGMAGFVVFCEVVSLCVIALGLWAAFATATSAAVIAQLLWIRALAGSAKASVRGPRCPGAVSNS